MNLKKINILLRISILKKFQCKVVFDFIISENTENQRRQLMPNIFKMLMPSYFLPSQSTCGDQMWETDWPSLWLVLLWLYLVTHLEDRFHRKRIFLLPCPRNQDTFWKKKHRNIGSKWFSFKWIKRTKTCLRNSCPTARKVFLRKNYTTNGLCSKWFQPQNGL